MMKILMIDDQLEVCKATKIYCMNNTNVELEYVDNLEAGLHELFDNNISYDAVILDGKGYMTKKDQKTKENHVVRGIVKIRERYPDMPIAVYTGYLDMAHDRLEEIPTGESVKIFEKTGKDPVGLFEFLTTSIESIPLYRVKRKYPELIDLFESGMIQHDEQLLNSFFELLMNYEENAFASLNSKERYGAFNTIRAVLEAMYKTLNDQAKHVVPDEMFYSGKMNFNSIKRHLSGNGYNDSVTGDWKLQSKKYQSQDIEYLSQCVYWIAGSHNHFNPKRMRALTNYALISNLFALFEIMMWYKHGWDSKLFYD